MPLVARLMRLPAAEVVVCSDAAMAKAIRGRDGSVLVCYCHSPMRYAWERNSARAYAAELPPPVRQLWPLIAAGLRLLDRRAAKHVDVWVANSATVARRVERAYGRSAVVVFPPVDVPDTAPHRFDGEAPFYLVVGHHVPYKRLDLAVQACRALGRRLVVIGDGPAVEGARAAAGAETRFLGYQPDEVIRDHYLRARALLFPGEEDFGIVPVEAMAHGCPVIAYGRGGAVETVQDGTTGVLFGEQTSSALQAAILRAEDLPFDALTLWEHARQFRAERFETEMADIIRAAVAGAST